MPARISRSSVQIAGPNTARKTNRKRGLDAYSAAADFIPSDRSVRQNRLGEFLDDGPKSKRRRTAHASDEEEEISNDEALPARPRRQGMNMEDAENGSDSEGNEWTMGGLREDDEDSELESDDAFGASDEERFSGFTFRGSSRPQAAKSKRQGNSRSANDLSEGSADTEDADDDFGDEGVDLATVLDDGGPDSENGDGEDDSSSDHEVEITNSGSEIDSIESDDEAENERMARMRDRIDALDNVGPTEKHNYEPQSATLTVEDLLADLDPAARKQFAVPLKTRKKSEQPKTLAAPLAPRQQSKIDREVASRKAKEQLDRWRDTITHNRRAEFLSFPLQGPDGEHRIGKDKFVQSAPQNDLENHIREIMENSGLASTSNNSKQQEEEESAILKSEGLAERDLPIEDVARRRAELRRLRELLFREEIKAKRLAKIKSKSYRRVHRKEKRRNALKYGSDDDSDKEARADRRRAEERMSTKHKDSKWAKSMKATNRTLWDDEARTSVNEQARRGEELRKRIAGNTIDGDGGSDVSTDDEPAMFEENDEDQALAQLNRMQRDGQDNEGHVGLAGMKFMRAAEERRRKQNDEDVMRLRKELAAHNDEADDTDELDDKALGRAVFGPKERERQELPKIVERSELEEGEAYDEGGRAAEEPNKDQVVIRTDQKPSTARQGRQPALATLRLEEVSEGDVDGESDRLRVETRKQEIVPLHRRAFAGDNVKAAFDAEKAAAIESDEEKEVNSHLPGWGSWTGEGLSKSVRKANNRQRHNPIYKTKLSGVNAQDRKDAKLENVLISEKQDRKGKKYKADILPHEFEKKQQYERSLRIPMGPEWVTKETFQRNTRPRVVVKPGAIVAPMERPLL